MLETASIAPGLGQWCIAVAADYERWIGFALRSDKYLRYVQVSGTLDSSGAWGRWPPLRTGPGDARIFRGLGADGTKGLREGFCLVGRFSLLLSTAGFSLVGRFSLLLSTAGFTQQLIRHRHITVSSILLFCQPLFNPSLDFSSTRHSYQS